VGATGRSSDRLDRPVSGIPRGREDDVEGAANQSRRYARRLCSERCVNPARVVPETATSPWNSRDEPKPLEGPRRTCLTQPPAKTAELKKTKQNRCENYTFAKAKVTGELKKKESVSCREMHGRGRLC